MKTISTRPTQIELEQLNLAETLELIKRLCFHAGDLSDDTTDGRLAEALTEMAYQADRIGRILANPRPG